MTTHAVRGRARWAIPLVLAIGLALLFAWRGRVRPTAPPPPAPAIHELTDAPGLDLYPSLSPDGRQVAWAAERDGLFELFVKGPDGAERPLTSDGRYNVQPAWSPDGSRIAYYSRGGGGIFVLPAEGGEPVRLTSFGARPAWSPDGTKIAFQSEPQIDASYTAAVPLPPCAIWVAPVDGGEPWPVTRTGQPGGGHGNPTWTPDGRQIVFVAYDRVSATLWRVAPDGTGLEPLPLPADQPLVSDPASCPGCDAVYYVSYAERGSSGVWKLRLDAPERGPEWVRSQIVGAGLQRVRHLSLSADGRRLAFSAVSANAQLASLPIDPRTGEPTGPPRLITHGEGRSSRPLFSPDGARLAFTKVPPEGRSDVWAAAADGSAPVLLTNHAANDTLPSWFPDGRRVAFMSDRAGHAALWVTDLSSRRATLLRDLGQPFDAPRLSPDGTRIAFHWTPAGGPLNTWLMSVDGGAPRQITFDDELVGFPSWAPDGRALALQMKRGDRTDVAILDLDAEGRPRGEPRAITRDEGLHWPHSWSPDGDKVAFAALRSGLWNIHWVTRSGQQRALTSYRSPGSYVRYPAWSPRGDRIVYEYAETHADIWTVDAP